MPIPNGRKQQLRMGVAVMIDLAWRSDQYAAETDVDGETDYLHLGDLPDDEVRYVETVIQRAIRATH